MNPRSLLPLLAIFLITPITRADEPICISGVYPHLRMWNTDNEAGTGAVVPWQGDLWAITYAPHRPKGSDDKLYRISPDLSQHLFEGSVGGTPANRMIHRETGQLLIGPYLINAEKTVRTIPPTKMMGRLTGNARHLIEPAKKVYYATMEEGLYEVDLDTLEVTCLIKDGHDDSETSEGVRSQLPGYHGKGLYSGQGRLVYSNNGEKSQAARIDPTVDSGALAEWNGEGDWKLILREQFTEVTGPGGIYGNENPDTDPIWAMGWDSKSLLLALLEGGEWHYNRLPKGSHSYDGAHGWNTEWPRIRDIGEESLLATMHGTFWDFPATFSLTNSQGITPRSNYLKVIGDFCRWNDHIVLGCDDSAKGEFLNTRPFKAEHGAPKQSNSNLWFIDPEALDRFGPAIGRGSVWMDEAVTAKTPSLPYLFSGYDHRLLHLSHGEDIEVTFSLEIDREGTNQWTELETITVAPGESVFHSFSQNNSGAWIRIRPNMNAESVTAHFQYRNEDLRNESNHAKFAGIAAVGEAPTTTGVMRSLAYNKLGVVSKPSAESSDYHYHELNSKMEFVALDDFSQAARLVKDVRQPERTFLDDGASLLLIEDGKRYRLPRNEAYALEEQPPVKGGDSSLEAALPKSLIRDADITVQSAHGDYEATLAADGEISEASRWIGGEKETNWIAFDFHSEKEVGSLWIVSGWKKNPAYVARNFDIQCKVDGAWKTVSGGEIRNNQMIEKEIRFETPLQTQHLRILSQDRGFFRVYEIAAFDPSVAIESKRIPHLGIARVCREVATERDLLNLHGTVYELPARNAQGVAKVRPIATHNLAIQDFCSHNGLLFFTGLDADTKSEHIFRSEDGSAALWAGVIDDLWSMGKPRGIGGPWKQSSVEANTLSDPYLMTGYDQKSVTILSSVANEIRLEVDVDGTGVWRTYRSFPVEANRAIEYTFPEAFGAYWIRAASREKAEVSLQFQYE